MPRSIRESLESQPLSGLVLLLVKNYCLFGTHRGGQKGAIILADLFGHQVVEQGIHPQDRVFVFVALQGEVMQLVGILAEIEKLDVVVLEDLIERLRSVERGGGIVIPSP